MRKLRWCTSPSAMSETRTECGMLSSLHHTSRDSLWRSRRRGGRATGWMRCSYTSKARWATRLL
ncbi:hypothetical protein C8T65DRAFT_662282 [Cerioporus squamosus]|nr:hypothetical protein C8T65DRAFT_662282 [Cerioporus squamosus]